MSNEINQDNVETKDMSTAIKSNESQMGEILAQMAKLIAENERLKLEQKAHPGSGPRQTLLKVSEKGGVTFNAEGMRRFGLTLYKQEWEVLFDNIDRVKAFVEENSNRLSTIKK